MPKAGSYGHKNDYLNNKIFKFQSYNYDMQKKCDFIVRKKSSSKCKKFNYTCKLQLWDDQHQHMLHQKMFLQIKSSTGSSGKYQNQNLLYKDYENLSSKFTSVRHLSPKSSKPAGCPGADQTCWYFGCSSATMHIKKRDMMTEHINMEAGVSRYEDTIFNKMISENVMLLLTYDQASDRMKTWLQALVKMFYLKRLWGTFMSVNILIHPGHCSLWANWTVGNWIRTWIRGETSS